MIYHIATYFKPAVPLLNVIHYTSFRVLAALLTSLFCSFVYGKLFIAYSQRFFRSRVREWTPENHKAKNNTPTMGGLLIISVVVTNTVLWCNFSYYNVWIFLVCLLGFGVIGFLDDWEKITKKRGISSRAKFLLQWTVALLVSFLLYIFTTDPTICFPFFKYFQPNIGLFFILWSAFLIVGFSNAVNLTDGLDGLAIGCLIPNFATFSVICFLAGHFIIAHYLYIPFVHTGEIAVIGATLVGASIGFLWYNSYPAQIFMGDVGSLALGASLAVMALMCKQELLLLISGGLFVVETLSVMLQVASFKLRGKRIFKMAPIHHHFELLGWHEAKITTRFGIITLMLCLMALITLKIR
jgi:phospho-N-acetylmuramoyl-pentapeptide-transferase